MAFFGLVLCRITGGCLNFALSGSLTKDLQVTQEPHLCYVPENLLEWHVVLSCCYSRLCIIQTTCRPDAEQICIQTVKSSHICVTYLDHANGNLAWSADFIIGPRYIIFYFCPDLILSKLNLTLSVGSEKIQKLWFLPAIYVRNLSSLMPSLDDYCILEHSVTAW